METTLSTYIGLREKTETTFKNSLDDMFKKFKNNQGIFRGERKTFTAIDGFVDEPTKRGYTHVQSTVKDQLDWMQKACENFMDIVFSIEKTNATGAVKAHLIVDGDDWGEYTSLELLRLKTTLGNSKLKGLYPIIPIRSQTERWKLTQDEAYSGRDDIFEAELEVGSTKTTIKETYILSDPHADQPGRTPQLGEKSTQVNTGNYTVQKFSGEVSMLERAKLIEKYDALETAVIAALERANNVPVEKSDLGSKVFAYLHS